jgi:hypothetical protein
MNKAKSIHLKTARIFDNLSWFIESHPPPHLTRRT